MKIKKLKKGFTLVELVVVIAIIAILSTVSVVGYLGFTKKANVSGDKALVSQLNTILKTNESETGAKPATASEAIGIVAEQGINVDRLKPLTSKYTIAWNSEANEFALLDENEEVVSGTLSKTEHLNWLITSSDSVVENTTYSTYLMSGYKGKKTLSVKTGLDVGENTNVTSVTYTKADEAKDVILRTNGGTLTVNADTDNVTHYGSSDIVNVKAVANQSYHEYGKVAAIVVNAGHVVVEEGATVTAIVVPNTVSTSDVTIKSVVKDVNVYAPEEVKVDGGQKKGAASNVENIVSGAKNFAGGQGTEQDPYSIKTGEQALKMEKSKSGFYRLDNDIIVTDEIYLSKKQITLDLNGHSIALEYGKDVKPNNGSTLYVGGSNGKLTIIDSSESQKGTVYGSINTYPNKVTSAVRVGSNGTLEIYGGNFVGRSEGTSCIFVYTNIATSSAAKVYIYGGNFKTESPSDGKYFVLNHQDNATAGCVITVYGGTFKNYNPGVTVVDPVNARTGKISLGEGCITTSTVDGDVTYYTVTKA